MSVADIETVRALILSDILRDESVEIAIDDDLIGEEILDSLSILRLVAELETIESIEVPEEDVTARNFGSLRRIDKYLRARKGE